MKIVTVIGTPTVTVTTSSGRTRADVNAPGAQDQTAVTIVNLLDGDAITMVTKTFFEDPQLRQFHAEQAEKSLAMLPANVEALVKVAQAVINELRDQRQ